MITAEQWFREQGKKWESLQARYDRGEPPSDAEGLSWFSKMLRGIEQIRSQCMDDPDVVHDLDELECWIRESIEYWEEHPEGEP